MRRVAFEKEVFEARLCSPLSGFKLELQPIEYRKDPLTAMLCRINLKRFERVKQAVESDNLSKTILEASKADCPFCSENLKRMTPCFPSQITQEERLRVGSSVLFPNLFPFGEYHSVAVFSDEHNPKLDCFPPEVINDCVKLSIDFMRRIHSRSQDLKYGSINWNYMPPAGSSIIHPHLQVVVDRNPTHFQDILVGCSEAYHRKYGGNFWRDLIETEAELKDRLIYRDDLIAWLASYAPQGNNEVLGVLPEISSIFEVNGRSLEALSTGISKILKGYNHLGVESFNMSIFSGPFDQSLNYYALNLRMSSRPRLKAYYTSDQGFMEKLHLESVVETKPEVVAGKLRNYFHTAK